MCMCVCIHVCVYVCVCVTGLSLGGGRGIRTAVGRPTPSTTEVPQFSSLQGQLCVALISSRSLKASTLITTESVKASTLSSKSVKSSTLISSGSLKTSILISSRSAKAVSLQGHWSINSLQGHLVNGFSCAVNKPQMVISVWSNSLSVKAVFFVFFQGWWVKR